MKTLLIIALLLNSFSAFADTTPIQKLEHYLDGKSLQCQPVVGYSEENKKSYFSGDMGYFKLAVKNNEILISENGGSGYGFAYEGTAHRSGGSLGTIVVFDAYHESIMYLTTGDDGHQTLVFDFNRLGSGSEDVKNISDNCSTGLILDASHFDYEIDASFAVKCCLI